MRKLLAAGVLVLAAGCGSQHVTQARPAAQHASAMASIPGASVAMVLATAGVPVNGSFTAKLAFARSMLTARARSALAARLSIPARNRSAFSAELLAAAKTDLASVRTGNVSAATTAVARFFTVDLPAALDRNA